MDLSLLYEEVQNRVDRINVQDIWNGFRKYEFALYNDDIVLLNGERIPKTDEFIANTAIFYQGRYIAIWYITKDMDVDRLTSKIIHEMFHAFQFQRKDCRFTNEVEAVCKYQYAPYYLQIKHNENLLLADLVMDFDFRKLDRFLMYRKLRQTEFPYEYNYENAIEAIEGSAQYIEFQVLKILREDYYTEGIKQLLHTIRSVDKLIPIRIISYDIGALILEVCVKNNLPLDLTIGGTNKIFYSQLIDRTPYRKIEIAIEPEVDTYYDNDVKMLKEKINSILANNSKVIRGDFELLGFNVYSARYLEGYIFSEYFLMYKDSQPVTLYGNYLFKFENNRITEIYKEI